MVISKDTLGCHSISLVEIRDAAKYTVQKTAPHQNKQTNKQTIIQFKMSIVPRLRSIHVRLSTVNCPGGCLNTEPSGESD